jgi:hypothetical protein
VAYLDSLEFLIKVVFPLEQPVYNRHVEGGQELLDDEEPFLELELADIELVLHLGFDEAGVTRETT